MFAGLRWSTPSGPRSCASCSPCSLEIEYGKGRWVHVAPVFGRSQTSPGFVCGFLREDAEIRECEPTPRLISVSGQHRNQTSIARETLSIFHPDICLATEDRRSSLHVGSLWSLRCGHSDVLGIAWMNGKAVQVGRCFQTFAGVVPGLSTVRAFGKGPSWSQ